MQQPVEKVSEPQSQTIAVIRPQGILDGLSGKAFRDEVDDQISAGFRHILINFESLQFIDSSGLGTLVAALKTVRSSGGHLYLCTVNQQITMVFDLTSMDRVFQIFPDQATAEATIVAQAL